LPANTDNGPEGGLRQQIAGSAEVRISQGAPSSRFDKLASSAYARMSQGELASGFQKLWKRLWSRSGQVSPWPTSVPDTAPEALLARARAFFAAEQAGDSQLELRKIEAVRHFDVAGMHRAVAVCPCGSSGSSLLTSYLDGHDEILMLPLLLSRAIYPFYDQYRSLPLRDKLMTYPFFSLDQYDHCDFFFQGDHRIAAGEYCAAVNAFLKVYSHWPPELLESRRTFFQSLHVVYCVARGQRPASPQPMMVYAQHGLNDSLASRLVEDFPQARFIHTVRDPITNCGRLFEHYFRTLGFMAPVYVISNLTFADAPHLSMESRTLTIRFEDLHARTRQTMGAIVDWLGLPYRSTLRDSTFNGVPFVVGRGTTVWSGARAEQALRDSRNVSVTDRCLLLAVLYEDFVAWNYPCPRIFRHGLLRVLAFMLVVLLPMRIEIITARRVLGLLAVGEIRDASRGLLRLAVGRAALILLLAAELYRRLVFGKQVLQLRETRPAA